MIPRGHRVVAFAGQVVGVEWSGAAARQATELAFASLTGADDRLPEVVFRIGSRSDTPLLTVFGGHTCLYRGDSLGTAAHLLSQAALDALIGRSTGGLVIHAAVLGRGDHGLLLPGATGSGKTMLSAWLSLRGLAPLSDEACYLADADTHLETFARPFCFKAGWAECLALDGLDPRRVVHDASVSLVPRELLSRAAAPVAPAPRLIVFPRYSAGAPFALQRLTPARAAVRLLETVANARNLSDHGRARVTALARTVEAYSLTYAHFDQLEPFVRLLESLH